MLYSGNVLHLFFLAVPFKFAVIDVDWRNMLKGYSHNVASALPQGLESWPRMCVSLSPFTSVCSLRGERRERRVRGHLFIPWGGSNVVGKPLLSFHNVPVTNRRT